MNYESVLRFVKDIDILYEFESIEDGTFKPRSHREMQIHSDSEHQYRDRKMAMFEAHHSIKEKLCEFINGDYIDNICLKIKSFRGIKWAGMTQEEKDDTVKEIMEIAEYCLPLMGNWHIDDSQKEYLTLTWNLPVPINIKDIEKNNKLQYMKESIGKYFSDFFCGQIEADAFSYISCLETAGHQNFINNVFYPKLVEKVIGCKCI
jgi:hypothetical protein